ncbi:MAG TPA: metallophosphoesterase [Labilithrix sp.]
MGRRVLAFAIALAVAWACSSSSKSDDPNTPLPASGAPTSAPPFDAAALPPPPPDASAWHAVVERDPDPSVVVSALSDVHGGWDRLAALLVGGGLAAAIPTSPDAIAWAGGSGILVVCGDLVDKGPQGLEVIDGLRALQASAAAAGGEVIVLLGNHEAEFFVDPNNTKATASDGFDVELGARHIDPASVASGADPHGAWLRDQPIAARVRGWFYSHAGNPKGRTIAALDLSLRAAIADHPSYLDPELVAADSILEARDWYGDPNVVAADLAALGVSHIVFGHDPNALGAKGSLGTNRAPSLLRIDCGMSPDVNDSTGCILRIRRDGGDEVADEVRSNGSARQVWRGPP